MLEVISFYIGMNIVGLFSVIIPFFVMVGMIDNDEPQRYVWYWVLRVLIPAVMIFIYIFNVILSILSRRIN